MVQEILCIALRVYGYILLARVIVSFIPMVSQTWRPPDGLRPLIDLIYALTEPPLMALRKVVPQPAGMSLDLSFIVLYVLFSLVRSSLCGAGLI